MNFRKLIIVMVFALFVLGVGFGLYWVFFRSIDAELRPDIFNAGQIPEIGPGELTIVNDLTNGLINGLPWQDYVQGQISPVASGGLTEVQEIRDGNVSGLAVGTDGLQFYDQTNQQFYRLDAKGQIQALSGAKFYQVQNVTWAAGGQKAILEYPDGSNVLYNFRTGQQVTLPPELEGFSFSA